MNSKKTEIWKDVPTYEGLYQVSNLGRVKSLDRVIHINGGSYIRKGIILKQRTNQKGYTYVELWSKGKGKSKRVHRLVGDSFLGKCPRDKVTNHINGVKTDNRVLNLEYVTHRENITTCFRADRKNMTSGYVGVSFDKYNNKWRAEIRYKGVKYMLGNFDSEHSASGVYQDTLKELKKDSFNYEEYKRKRLSANKAKCSSRYKGVSLHKATNTWKAYITENGEQIGLGYYKTEIEAYKRVKKQLTQQENG